MINLEMDRNNLQIRVLCKECEHTQVNTREFLTALDKFVAQLEHYDTVFVSITNDNTDSDSHDCIS